MRKEFSRVIIENVCPKLDCGNFPIRRVVGEKIEVSADIFAEGSFILGVNLIWKKDNQKEWNTPIPMIPTWNDSWTAQLTLNEPGLYTYAIEAWIDYFATWCDGVRKKIDGGDFNFIEIENGIRILEKAKNFSKALEISSCIKKITSNEALLRFLNEESVFKTPNICFSLDSKVQSHGYKVVVKRKKALFSTWYELFPRSTSDNGSHGTFSDCIKLLPYISKMGFDTIYLPPIHPIGKTARKGGNNSLVCEKNSPGSPWAIGSDEGGHDAIHSELGDLNSFKKLIQKASEFGIEIALDLAFQCSPDHPYLKSHPKWFQWRSDGTVQFAENPPKKYEDIVPFYFDTPDSENLWAELKRIVIYWIDQGVKIFRVDNPHTKPFSFWEWLIEEIFQYDSEVLFLSEAFTRPKLMQRLAKIGFDQSYTYFTWRNTKNEIEFYVKELVFSELKEFFKPNFWPNTPDILPESLQHGGKSAFIARYVLAATLSSNCGIYGPAYELCVNKPFHDKEEYLDSEKYEIKNWNRSEEGNIIEIITLVNRLRRENSALQTTWNIEFINTENDKLIGYIKKAIDKESSSFLIIVNLDYYNTQAGMVNLPLDMLGLSQGRSFLVQDQITKEKYVWSGSRNYVELNPHHFPMHILKFYNELKDENDFDYFISNLQLNSKPGL